MEEKKYPVLRIEHKGDEPNTQGASVYLNGEDISSFLRKIVLTLDADIPVIVATVDIVVKPDIPELLTSLVVGDVLNAD